MPGGGFNKKYDGARVLVTGHTGFKGSWLYRWLSLLGAKVVGYALEPPTQPNHFDLLDRQSEFMAGDVRNLEHLRKIIIENQPEVVFHLAAQPIVRYSYHNPVETFETNIIGTVNLLEACRSATDIKGIIVITSDKCYEDRSIGRGFRENDPLGGDDPYSCSKGCAELVTASYRKSFFSDHTVQSRQPQVASARAGNVIGGGDWGFDRIVPDIMRAANSKKAITLRNPDAVRPWQHVLDALSGYLLLGQYMLESKSVDSAWNFGPIQESGLTVIELVQMFKKILNLNLEIQQKVSDFKEIASLRLDSTKARKTLGWRSVWDAKESVKKTVAWYQAYYQQNTIITDDQIKEYMKSATGI